MFVISQTPTKTFITHNDIKEFISCTSKDSCSSGKHFKPLLSLKTKHEHREQTGHDLQQSQSHLGIGQTTLGCRKQPVDSQIRSYREKPCSRKTRGPPPASLSSSQSPSSPRRRSSEGEEVRRRSREEEEAEKRKVRSALQSSTTHKVLYTRKRCTRIDFLLKGAIISSTLITC